MAAYTLAAVRRMTPAAYGDFAFVVALSVVLAAVGDGGLSRLIMRDVARTGAGPGSSQLLAVRMGWIAAIALLSLVAWLVGVVSFGFGTLLLLLIYMVAEAGTLGFESLAVATEQPWRITVGQLLQGLGLITAGTLLLLSHRATEAGAVAGLAAPSAVKFVWHVSTWLRGLSRRTVATQRAPLASWAREAAPFLALSLLAVFYYRVGVIALHVERGGAATAPYAAAFRVVEAVAAGAGVMFSAVAPAFSRAHVDRPEQIWRLWVRLIRVTAVGAASLAAAIALLAHPLARTLFGARYGVIAGDDLRLLCPGMAFLVLQAITASVVLMSDDHSNILLLTLVNVCFCVTATAVLVGTSGSSGAALATSLSECVSFFGFALLVRRRHLVVPPQPSERLAA